MRKDRHAPQRSARPLIIFGLAAIFATIAWRMYQDSGQRFIGTIPTEFPATGAWIGSDKPLRLSDYPGVSCCCSSVSWVAPIVVRCSVSTEVAARIHFRGIGDRRNRRRQLRLARRGRNWAASSAVPYPVYYDDGARMCGAYNIDSFPYLLLIGRDGKVVWESRGWLGKAGMKRPKARFAKR